MQMIRRWFSRHFNDPQVVGLGVLLMVGFGVIIVFGNMLAPVLASLVLAYLLEGLVRGMENMGAPRLPAVLIVFILFFAALVLVLFSLLPVLTKQLTQLIEQLPAMLNKGQEVLLHLPQEYPNLFSQSEMQALVQAIRRELVDFGQRLLASISLQSVVVVVTLLVYLVLVPFLVFFFLKDKNLILNWLSHFLPRDRGLADTVWNDVHSQIGNYVRGKFLEILIVWFVAYATFSLMGLGFAMLLGVAVGLSVIVPYIGAAVVTLPVAIIGYSQFGLSNEFAYIMLAYGIIQALDGNVLAPVLFSEVVDLHPVAIIVAILIFGGLWGFWGVFFAIPLATLIQAIIKAWPRAPVDVSPALPEQVQASGSRT